MANVILGTEPNDPLTYAPGSELHHPIVSMLGGNRRRLEIDRYFSVLKLLSVLVKFLGLMAGIQSQ